MAKYNILFAIIGASLGFILAFMFATSVNRRAAQPGTAMALQNPTLPPDHPPISDGAHDQQGPAMANVQATLKLAKEQPENFDAQMSAAQAYFEIQRFDQAIEYLKNANRLRPDTYDPIVNLGNAYFDSGLFEEAENWYTKALKIKPDDIDVRTDFGLTFLFRSPPDIDRAIKEFRSSLERNPDHIETLQNLTVALIKKGDAKEAQATLARLEAVNPSNPALAKLRSEIASIGSPGDSQEASMPLGSAKVQNQ